MEIVRENLPPSDDSIPIAGVTLTDSIPLVDLSQLFTVDELKKISRKYQKEIFRCSMRRLNRGEITDSARIEFCLKHIKDEDLFAELENHPHWPESRKHARKNVGENY